LALAALAALLGLVGQPGKQVAWEPGKEETVAGTPPTLPPRRPAAASVPRHEPPAASAASLGLERKSPVPIRSLAALDAWCAEPTHAGTTVALVAHVWAALRARTAAAVATASCASSRWPVREALRPFLASMLLAPEAAQTAGGYLVTDVPVGWSDNLAAHVPRAAACAAAALAATWTRDTVLHHTPAYATVGEAARTLCPSAEGPAARLRLDASVVTPADLAWERPCASWSSGTSESSLGAVERLLLDAVLPDETLLPSPSAGAVPCDTRLSTAALRAQLAQNVAAIHYAPPTAVLHTPSALADAVLRPVPIDNLLPLLLPNAADLAAAAVRADVGALVHALTPPVVQATLPGVLTSFHVMVSPLGVLTALRPPRAPPADGEEPGASGTECPADLDALFEPAPPASEADVAAERAFELVAVGGHDALARVRRLAPLVQLLSYWPARGGVNLTEAPAPAAGSATLDVFNVHTPERDDQPVPHAACGAWDHTQAKNNGGGSGIVLLAEVVVLSHSSDLFYWVTVDLVGRLQLLVPYLMANPHVRVHVAYAAARPWARDPGHFARQWLNALGLGDRLVTGRVVARIAHVVDRLPCGPRVHPLQLLAVRDAGERVLAAAGLPSLAQLHRERTDPASGNGTLLLLQRQAQGPRYVPNMADLTKHLHKRGLVPTVWDPPPATPGSLAATIALWARTDAVVAPHGSGLANALFMRPGATVIETVPRSHAGTGLYYLQLAHVVRLRHHHIVMPGTLVTPVAHDIVLVEALLCGDRVTYTVTGQALPPAVLASAPFGGTKRGRCLPEAASSLLRRDERLASPRHPSGQLHECLPAPRPPGGPVRLTVHEPVHALAPLADVVARVPCERRTPYSVVNGTDELQRPWTSPTMQWAQARAVAVLLPGGNLHADFFSLDPTQRGLVRALEDADILPVAMPGLLCCNASQICYLNFGEPCAGPHVSLLSALTGAVVEGVARARGVAPADVPVVVAGLSSGGGFGGLLAAHVRVAAVFAQLEPPSPLVIHAHNASMGTAPRKDDPKDDDGCRVVDLAPIVRVTVPVEAAGGTAGPVHPTEWRAASALASVLPRPVRAAPPALWLTGTPLHPSDLHNVLTFEARWHAALGRPLPLSRTNTSTAADGDADAYAARADPDGYVYNSWTPAALSAAALHRAAPWLWSRAGATLFVDYALATGLLEVPSAAYLAAHGSHRPWCLRDRAFGDAPDDPVPDTAPATDVPGGA
jgi:hypothetical protein